ncbi:13509_t:CDS:2, partial [Ambispora leptoticha]
NNLNSTISQFLASYIYVHIWEANLRGKQIQDISSEICFKFTTCTKQDCRKHHVVPTPLILFKRFELACLQYTVMQQLDVIYNRCLLKKQQSETIRGAQRWWAEILVKFHIRYQSPQTSCPEVTYAVLAKLPKHTRSRLISLGQKIWLYEDYWGIDEFNREMSQKIALRHRRDLPIGYDYYDGYHEAIPVGKRLTTFFSNLYDNRVLDAIKHIEIFIQYAIDNAKLVNMNTFDA